MNIKEFYEKYNLNRYEFASIAGVGTKSLIKFAEGEELREDARLRIEKAMRIADKYNLVRPKYDYTNNPGFLGNFYRGKRLTPIQEYTIRFKELIATEN